MPPLGTDPPGTDPLNTDPFGTAGIRRRVLAAWAAAAERFREDANAEEDMALGGYRDRLVVELAQNAADAASAAGVPGRLLLRLYGGVLLAANTGSALDGPGVVALSTLRASAKRDGAATGRFGVGFAAVLAVSDEPAVVGSGTGVRFSRADSQAVVAAVASEHEAMRAEVQRRGGQVPSLRLPWPDSGSAPDGYDTAVMLPLRDAAAHDLAVRLLREVDDALLLSLPALAEVVVELPGEPLRRLADVGARWATTTRTGVHPPEVLADRPTEERARPGWSLTWALPVQGSPVQGSLPVPRVLHAPTPTDEPMAWPALLVADYPLDPTRRHVAPGPAAQAVTAAAAAAYADLLATLAAGGRDVVPLVPVGLPASALDSALREQAWVRLRSAAVLRAVETGRPVEPRDAVALTGAVAGDEAALAVLAPLLPGLVPAPAAAEPALKVLGVRRLDLAEVVEALPAEGDPAVWSGRYAGLAGASLDSVAREALSALPVPLADGRVVRGVRGLLLPAGLEGLAEALSVLAGHGVRVVHPGAVAASGAVDLLERLGAVPASASAVLDHPAMLSAVRWTGDDPDPGEVSQAVLAVVAAAWDERPWAAGERGWLADLALPDADGDPTPAGLLVQPGSPVSELLEPGTVGTLHPDVAGRWPPDVLQAVGVAGHPVLVRCTDVDPGDLPPELAELDGAPEWASQVLRVAGGGPAWLGEVLAVRDLDLVRADAWPAMLDLLAADPDLRRAVVEEVLVGGGRAGGVRAPSYSAWWLRQELGLAGAVVPGGGGGGESWQRLLPQAPQWAARLDPGMRTAMGIVTGADDLAADDWLRLLGRLGLDGDPAGTGSDPPSTDVLLQVWDRVARAAEELLAARDGEPVPHREGWALGPDLNPLRHTGSAVVVDDARWLQRRDLAPLVLAPAGYGASLADLLDLDLATEVARGAVTSTGRRAAVPPQARRVLLGAGAAACPHEWVEHDDLRVDGVAVDWWLVGGAGDALRAHASTSDGLAHALAALAGRWSDRHLLAVVLRGEQDPGTALAERLLG